MDTINFGWLLAGIVAGLVIGLLHYRNSRKGKIVEEPTLQSKPEHRLVFYHSDRPYSKNSWAIIDDIKTDTDTIYNIGYGLRDVITSHLLAAHDLVVTQTSKDLLEAVGTMRKSTTRTIEGVIYHISFEYIE